MRRDLCDLMAKSLAENYRVSDMRSNYDLNMDGVIVDIPRELHRQINAFCISTGKSFEEIVADAVEMYIDTYDSRVRV